MIIVQNIYTTEKVYTYWVPLHPFHHQIHGL